MKAEGMLFIFTNHFVWKIILSARNTLWDLKVKGKITSGFSAVRLPLP